MVGYHNPGGSTGAALATADAAQPAPALGERLVRLSVITT
jgi:hypothetical protein